MNKYTILYAQDVSHYATEEIEAANEEEAIKKAMANPNIGDLSFEDPDWNNPVCLRIIHILDANAVAVAQDLPLDGHQLLMDSKVRDAVQYTLECLGAFKPDWIANNGLSVVVEKLQAAYAELGGAA